MHFSSALILIGCANSATPSNFLSGYVDDLRITVGQHRHSYSKSISNISADPYENNTTINLSGLSNSISDTVVNQVIDGAPLIVQGDTSFSNTQKKFGDTSIYFDGTGGFFYIYDAASLTFTGDLTVELWVYLLDVRSSNPIIEARSGVNLSSYVFYIRNDSGTYHCVLWDQGNNMTFSQSVPIQQWVHVAFVKSNNTLMSFVNGVKDNTTFQHTTSLTPAGSTYALFSLWDGIQFYGYIQDFRVIKGAAKYTSNFDVPTDIKVSSIFAFIPEYSPALVVDQKYDKVTLLIHGNRIRERHSFS